MVLWALFGFGDLLVAGEWLLLLCDSVFALVYYFVVCCLFLVCLFVLCGLFTCAVYLVVFICLVV